MDYINREKLIENVKDTARENGIPLGILENYANVRPGYLSRIKKGEITSLPPIDVLYTFANKLGVTVDYLIKHRKDIALTINEKFTADFIDKVVNDTDDLSMNWLTYKGTEITIDENNMFTDLKTAGDVYERYLKSKSKFDPTAKINSMCCIGKLINSSYSLLIMNMEYKELKWDDKTDEKDLICAPILELYLVNELEDPQPVCNTQYINIKLNDKIFDLYNMVRNMNANVILNSKTKNIMHNYMNGYNPDNEEGLPFL